MDTMQAFAYAQASRGREHNVFDWEKAARLIVERKPEVAEAGLQGDMEWTGGDIWANGTIVPREDTYTYLSSNWATPVLVLDGEEIECFKKQSQVPDWGAETYWPAEAVAIVSV